MSLITRENVQSFCRLCLTELEKRSVLLGEKYNIHEMDNLTKWLQTCTAITAVPSDPLPKFVCGQCYDKLGCFYEFRCMSLRSMHILSSVLTGNEEHNGVLHTDIADIDSKQFENDALYGEGFSNAHWFEFQHNTKSSPMRHLSLTQPTAVMDEVDDKGAVMPSLHEPIYTEPIELPTIKVEVDKEHEPENTVDIGSPLRENQIRVDEFQIDETNVIDHIQLPDVTNLPAEQADVLVQSPTSGSDKEPQSFESDCSSSSYKPAAKRKKASGKSKSKIASKSSSKKKVHSSTIFQCDRCPRRCFNQDTFEAHKRTHDGLKPYECAECKRTFSKAHHYRLHMREAHPAEKQEIACTFEGCGKVFERETTYKAHYRTKHTQVPRERQRCVCEQCGCTFRNVTKLKEHSYRHASIETYPFKCDQCDKCFNKKRSYNEHLLRHAGIKNFVCSFCGMKKTTREELRVHLNCHTKQKQWRCELCQAVFTKAANMARHVRVVHEGVKEYACSYCDQRFGKPETWKHHEMRHTGEKPHGCEICGKRFIQVVALRTHMKTHNKYGHESKAQLQQRQPQSQAQLSPTMNRH